MEQSWDEQFTALYITQFPQLYRLAYRWLGSRERAEDVVQTAFTIMKMEQETMVSHPKPEAWLAATLVNLLKNEQRRMANRELSLEALTEERENGGPPLQIASPPPDPGIREILPGGLSEEDRQVLIWRFEEGLSYREIADRLGISEGGSRNRLSRALQKCRDLMGEGGLSHLSHI